MSCKEATKTNQEVVETNPGIEANPSSIPISWVNNRVEKAKKRLDSSEAGKVVWDAMEAMGGLNKWYSNGYLSFRFNYQPLDGSVPRDTCQTIDTWSNKARHRSVTDSTAIYGWD